MVVLSIFRLHDILKSGILVYHNHFISPSVPLQVLSDFSFAKLAQAACLKGSRPALIQRFFQKVLGQVCLNPKSFKSRRMK